MNRMIPVSCRDDVEGSECRRGSEGRAVCVGGRGRTRSSNTYCGTFYKVVHGLHIKLQHNGCINIFFTLSYFNDVLQLFTKNKNKKTRTNSAGLFARVLV